LAQLLVDVRIVNDLAGQEYRAAGETPPGLVRIIDCALHAVTEAELAREMEHEAARFEAEVVGADAIDERAVVRRRELTGNGLLHVEALAENQRLRRSHHPTFAAHRRAARGE